MSFNSTVLALSPLDFFRFSETSGTTATNLATIGRPGTYNASVTLNVTPGLIINEASTPGCSMAGGTADTGVSVANPSITGDFTVVAVLKAVRPSDAFFSCIFGANPGSGLDRLAFGNSSGTIYAQFGSTTLSTSTLMPASQTVVITLVNNTITNTQTVYINSSPDGASVAAASGLSNSYFWGQYRNGGSDYKLNGTLGAGALFASALTPAQVKSIVASALAEFSSPNDPTYLNALLTQSPIRLYALNEVGGSLAQDFSTTNSPGSYTGAVTQNVTPGLVVSDPSTPCISLPGGDGVTSVSNGVSCSSLEILSGNPFTIEFLFKFDAFQPDQQYEVLFGQTGNSGANVCHISIYQQADSAQGQILAQFGQNYFATTKAVAGKLYHFVFVNDTIGNSQKFYLNGVQDSTSSLTGITVPDLNLSWWIGQFDGSNKYKYGGKIQYVTIYPSALSTSTVLQHANIALSQSLTVSPSSLSFLNPASISKIISVSRPGYIGDFYVSASGSGVSSVSPSYAINGSTPSIFTISPVSSGSDSITITDDTGASMVIPVTVGATGGLTISNISAAFVPNGTFQVSETNYDGPFTVSVSDYTIANVIAPSNTNGPGSIAYEVIGVSPGVATITVSDNHGGTVSFQVSIDFTTLPFPASVNFVDIYGNPLPPSLRVDFFLLPSGPDSSNIVASDYLGVGSSAEVTLIVGQAYRIEYTGFGAPPLPSFFTPSSTSAATIVPDRYISPWANRDGYAQFMAGELWPLNRSSLAARTHGGGVYLLFQTFAAVLAQLDLFGRTNAAGERLVSSVDGQVDSWAKDFLGTTFLRLPQETNAAYIARIIAWLTLPFGTIPAIKTVVTSWFALNPDDSASVDVFDRQTDPTRSARYGLTPGQFAVIGYYPMNPMDGWFIGQSFIGQDTWITDPYHFTSSSSPPYSGLGEQVNRVKAAGAVPVYITSRGEP